MQEKDIHANGSEKPYPVTVVGACSNYIHTSTILQVDLSYPVIPKATKQPVMINKVIFYSLRTFINTHQQYLSISGIL